MSVLKTPSMTGATSSVLPAQQPATVAIGTSSVLANDPTKRVPIKEAQTGHSCDVCQIVCCSRQQLGIHLAGSKHAKRLKQFSQQKTRDNDLTVDECSPTKKSKPNEEWYCTACGVQSNAEPQHRQHLKGAKHKKITAIGGGPSLKTINAGVGVGAGLAVRPLKRPAPVHIRRSFVSAGTHLIGPAGLLSDVSRSNFMSS